MPARQLNRDRWRRYWDKQSASYDKQMQFWDRVLFADSRSWVCSQATGDTIEVAIGTGMNLPFYPSEVQLTGVDLSPAMLAIARRRAEQLGRAADLREADALALPFPDASFDTVVCTFSLCAVPDERRAVGEMSRVLRTGGLLLLADHIAGAAWPVRAVQRILEVVTVPLQGEHFLRRPLHTVEAEGFKIERRERFKLGLTERLTVPLAKITFEGLTQWVSRLTLGGLGPSGIRQSVFVMSAALDHAVRAGRIRSNPAHGLGLPRPQRRDYVYLTHEQLHALAAETGPWRVFVLLLGYTGLRWGEATALRVCDLDLARRRIDVRRAFADVGGRVVLGTSKSHQSRTLPIPRFLAREITTAVVGKHADDLAFTTPSGSILRLPNWRRSVFLSSRARAGISSRFRPHDLRRTAAALMIQAGYPPKMLQEIMGHASITTTLDLYGHLYPGDMDGYADRPGNAAELADPARIRPDAVDDDPAVERPGL